MIAQHALPGFETEETVSSLFFALLPAADASQQAYSLGASLKERLALKGYLMPMDRQHMTVHKLGDFPGGIPPDLRARALQAGSGIQATAFDLVLDEVMNMGSPANSVVALAGGNGLAALQALSQALTRALGMARIKSLPKLTAPHVSLIYGSSPITRQPVKPVGWHVRELVLVESLVGKQQHKHLGRWPLQSA